MACCAVSGCKNKSYVQIPGQNIRYYRFPNDPRLLTSWVKACNRSETFNLKSSRVCSEHFDETDLDPKYLFKKTHMGYSPKTGRRIKHDAVPHINLPLCKGQKANIKIP